MAIPPPPTNNKPLPKPKHQTATIKYKEQYLNEALDKLVRPLFIRNGYEVPAQVRISTGFPSAGGLGTKKRTLAQAWNPECSADGTHELIVSVTVDNLYGPDGVFSCLIHEVCHATVGTDAGHGKLFAQCARAVGLTEGSPAHAGAGPELDQEFASWEAKLGPYPHAKLDSLMTKPKKQGTRMLKMACVACGATVRTTRKYIDLHGKQWPCPCGKQLVADIPDEDEEFNGDD